MIIRQGHSEEYRKHLRERHILEAILLIDAAMIIVLAVTAAVQQQAGLLPFIISLGILMNVMLAVRFTLVRFWIGAASALFLAVAFLGGLLYLLYF